MIGPHFGMLLMLALLLAVFVVPCVSYVAIARHPQPRSVGLICFVVHACLVLMLATDMLIEGMGKTYQVKQVRDLLLKYKLRMED